MKSIIPAVLSEKLEDYVHAINVFESLPGNHKVHMDIMDGEFVNSTSADLESILTIDTVLEKQVHLMVKHPLEDLKICNKYGVQEVIIHYESDLRDYEILRNFKQNGMKIYLGINPEVDVINIPIMKYLLLNFDGILIMTVVPGKQGGEFLPSELMEILELRSIGYGGKIIEDGHVSKETIEFVKHLDIDEFVVGSAIIKDENPLKAYNYLKERLGE